MGKNILYRKINNKIDIKEYFKKVKYVSANRQLSLTYGYGNNYYQEDYDDGLYDYDSMVDYSQYSDRDSWVDSYYQEKNKNNNSDVYDKEDIDDSAIYDEKTIYYYEPTDDGLGKPVRIFHNLAEFDSFLDEENISVDENDVYNYVFYDVIHCSLDPVKLRKGIKDMVSDISLDGLEWALDLYNVEYEL